MTLPATSPATFTGNPENLSLPHATQCLATSLHRVYTAFSSLFHSPIPAATGSYYSGCCNHHSANMHTLDSLSVSILFEEPLPVRHAKCGQASCTNVPHLRALLV